MSLYESMPQEPEPDEGPWVCPGCQAVGGEACASWCIDAEIERTRQFDEETRDMYEEDYPGDDGEDIEW